MFKQIFAVTALNFQSLRNRIAPSLVIVVGMACVVGVLLSLLSFTTGLLASINRADDPHLVIVTTLKARSTYDSAIPRNSLAIIADAPGIAKDAAGKPIADAMVQMGVPTTTKIKPRDVGMNLRGVGPQERAVEPQKKVIQGRWFRPGTRELVVGRAAQPQFANTGLGDKVTMPDGQWTIVGVFSSGGDNSESAFIADRDTIMTANRKNTFNAITIRLTSPDAFETFRHAVTTNPALSVKAERLSTFIARDTDDISLFLNSIIYIVGGVLALGAMFGAINTMYAAVSARAREIATLRALGFGNTAVVISVIAEALFLALIGALIGAAAAWLFFDGHPKDLGGNVFNLMISPGLVLTGVIWAMVVGLLGGLFPSIRAARAPIATALRAT